MKKQYDMAVRCEQNIKTKITVRCGSTVDRGEGTAVRAASRRGSGVRDKTSPPHAAGSSFQEARW